MHQINNIHTEKFGVDFHSITDSQLADYWVMDTLGDIDDGTFIEAGGSLPSTCINLEKYYKWTGYIFEPNDHNYEIISKLRDNTVSKMCLWKDRNGVEFLETNQPNDSYIDGCLSPTIKYTPESITSVNKVTKSSVTLNEVFEKANWKHCNFISLDIEGAEGSVIEIFDTDTYSVDCWQIEGGHNYFHMLQSKGYTLVEQPFARMSGHNGPEWSPRDTFDKFYINNKLLDNYKHRIFENIHQYFAWCDNG
jgi:FkbM family methyltransferase